MDADAKNICYRLKKYKSSIRYGDTESTELPPLLLNKLRKCETRMVKACRQWKDNEISNAEFDRILGKYYYGLPEEIPSEYIAPIRYVISRAVAYRKWHYDYPAEHSDYSESE